MAVVTMRQLLDAGVHLGHQTRRWNPKMRRYLYGERSGIYLIDLHKTLRGVETSYTYVRDLVADGGSILFVGTKKQAQGPISGFADACGMPFVNQRWLGGKLSRNLSGIAGMDRLPSAIFVVDTNKEHIAVTEARKLGLPVVAVVDTNCDPDVIDYVIPGNDDAIRSGALMCRIIADAVVEGRFIAANRPKAVQAAAAAPEPPAPAPAPEEVPVESGSER